MAEFQKSEILEEIAKKVINEYDIFTVLRDGKCRIAFQYAKGEKKSGGKVVFADTERVKDKFKEFMPYDFVITFYEGNTFHLGDVQMEHLMYHELKHVGYDPEDEKFTVIPHDLEDFKDVIDKWGVDWISPQQD